MRGFAVALTVINEDGGDWKGILLETLRQLKQHSVPFCYWIRACLYYSEITVFTYFCFLHHDRSLLFLTFLGGFVSVFLLVALCVRK